MVMRRQRDEIIGVQLVSPRWSHASCPARLFAAKASQRFDAARVSLYSGNQL